MHPLRAFTDHPRSVGETYLQHMRAALGFSLTMARAAACCSVHAFLPFLFQRTGSGTVEELSRTMLQDRTAHGRSAPPAAAEERGNRP